MNSTCAPNVSLHDTDSHSPAGSPPHTAANRVPPEPEEAPPEGAAERGRPSTCTPGKVHAICTFIRLTGLSDTAAAAMAGVTRSTLARWKKEDEEVELMLEQARYQYQAPRLAKIDETRMKDGQHDWRAQAWLVKFANPELYGAPSRRRKLRDVDVEPEAPRGPEPVEGLTPEEKRAKEEAEGMAELEQAFKDWELFNQSSKAFFESGKVITPAMLALLQQRRAIALREMKEEEERAAAQGSAEADADVQNARTEDEPAQEDAAASPEPGAGAAKSVTIRPEIHGLYRDDHDWARPAAAGAPPPATGAMRRTPAMAG
jgi:hypothetical protein